MHMSNEGIRSSILPSILFIISNQGINSMMTELEELRVESAGQEKQIEIR